MSTLLIIFILYYFQSKLCATTTNKHVDQKCVVIFTSQNKYILYQKFYYLQDRCIHFTSKNNQMQKTNAAILVKVVSELNISNCILVTALDNHQQNLLAGLVKLTHIAVPDYSHELLLLF